MMAIVATGAGFPQNDNWLALNDLAQRAAACFGRLCSHHAGNCTGSRPAGAAIGSTGRSG